MCTDLEFQMAYRLNLNNSPALYRLSKVQAELESEGVSHDFQETMSLVYLALYDAGLNLSFPEEEFRNYGSMMMILSTAEIRDALSPDKEIVATGNGYSVMENIADPMTFQTSDFDYFNEMILKTRRSALSGLFAHLFSPEKTDEPAVIPSPEEDTDSKADVPKGNIILQMDLMDDIPF